MHKIKLNNGIEMPVMGYGVFQISDNEQCEGVVLNALKVGYRLIDTASVYYNEEAVGKAIRRSGIPREELFITTKAWITETGWEKTKKAFENSLKRLGVDYIDLYLLHMPFGDYYGSWRAMEELYKEGKIRAIGVCNFSSARLMDLCYNAEIIPAVNQIEMHPFHQQTDALKIMKELGVQPEAWGPFAEGKNGIFKNEILTSIGKKYGKTSAQVMLRWNIQRGVVVIPKSVHKERIEENFNVWDFKLDEEDMKKISELDTKHSLILDTSEPTEVKRLYNIKGME